MESDKPQRPVPGEVRMKAMRVHRYGGPEAMIPEEIPPPKPGEGETLVRLEAVGVNFIDIYQRMGLYPMPLPFTPGNEGAGTVAETGPAAAAMLQGMTAHYLSHDTYPLKPGNACLVHAAAGGVGLLLVQMAKQRGARVIGTVSTPEKARLAREAGADDVILYAEKDFETEVRRITGGQGVEVVYDSVGQATFEKSMNCLTTRGYLVLYGQSSGPVPPFDPQALNTRGGLFLTRPSLGHYTRNREELLARANQVLGWVGEGRLRVRIGETFPLANAGEAHRKLAGRETTGKVLLIP